MSIYRQLASYERRKVTVELSSGNRYTGTVTLATDEKAPIFGMEVSGTNHGTATIHIAFAHVVWVADGAHI